MSELPFDWSNSEEKSNAFNQAMALANSDVDEFWRREARRLTWDQPFHTVHHGDFADGKWFVGGTLNVSVNCLDRHIASGSGHKRALVFENERGDVATITYQELLDLTCHIAAILHHRGVRSGDRVAIYMPTVGEAIASMLACTRIGAIHTVIFGGFSKEALIERISDAEAKTIITAESTQRKGQALQFLRTVNDALLDQRCGSVSTVLAFGLNADAATDVIVPYEPQRDWPPAVKTPVSFDAEHPLFILYTSGTTGKPKGLLHTTGGYLTQVVSTTKWSFDLSDDDLYWCTADVGWITGHSYVAYGPLALGKSIFIYDGALNWPDASRIYQLIDRHGISVLY